MVETTVEPGIKGSCREPKSGVPPPSGARRLSKERRKPGEAKPEREFGQIPAFEIAIGERLCLGGSFQILETLFITQGTDGFNFHRAARRPIAGKERDSDQKQGRQTQNGGIECADLIQT